MVCWNMHLTEWYSHFPACHVIRCWHHHCHTLRLPSLFRLLSRNVLLGGNSMPVTYKFLNLSFIRWVFFVWKVLESFRASFRQWDIPTFIPLSWIRETVMQFQTFPFRNAFLTSISLLLLLLTSPLWLALPPPVDLHLAAGCSARNRYQGLRRRKVLEKEELEWIRSFSLRLTGERKVLFLLPFSNSWLMQNRQSVAEGGMKTGETFLEKVIQALNGRTGQLLFFFEN